MRIATFAEMKAEADKLDTEGRIAKLEKCLEWMTDTALYFQEERGSYRKQAIEANTKLADLKKAISELL